MRKSFLSAVFLSLFLLILAGCQRSTPSQDAFVLEAENADFSAYSGQMTVKGNYYRVFDDELSGSDITCFSPDESSLKKIAISSLKQGGFCFDNANTANELLSLDGPRDPKVCRLDGTAEIVIADYTVDKHPNHPQDMAAIKGVIASSAPVSMACDQ